MDSKLISEVGGNTTGHFLSSDFGTGYFADNPGLYTLSADVFLNSSLATSKVWQIGFNNSTNSSDGANRNLFSSDTPLAGSPAIELNANGRVRVKAVAGIATAVLTTADGLYPVGNWYNLKLVLDTTLTNWTFDAYVDNVPLDLNGIVSGNTYTYATNPTIRYAAVSSNITSSNNSSGASYLDNVTLTYTANAVPLPPAVLAGAGLLGMLAFSRRKPREA